MKAFFLKRFIDDHKIFAVYLDEKLIQEEIAFLNKRQVEKINPHDPVQYLKYFGYYYISIPISERPHNFEI